MVDKQKYRPEDLEDMPDWLKKRPEDEPEQTGHWFDEKNEDEPVLPADAPDWLKDNAKPQPELDENGDPLWLTEEKGKLPPLDPNRLQETVAAAKGFAQNTRKAEVSAPTAEPVQAEQPDDGMMSYAEYARRTAKGEKIPLSRIRKD